MVFFVKRGHLFLGVDVLCLVCSKPFLVKTFHLILVCYFRVYHCLVQGLLRLLGFSFYYNLLVLLSIVLPSVFVFRSCTSHCLQLHPLPLRLLRRAAQMVSFLFLVWCKDFQQGIVRTTALKLQGLLQLIWHKHNLMQIRSFGSLTCRAWSDHFARCCLVCWLWCAQCRRTLLRLRRSE